MTTVGYGDMAPTTPWGRLLAVLIMFSGITLIAIVTGTISSIFTTGLVEFDLNVVFMPFENYRLHHWFSFTYGYR